MSFNNQRLIKKLIKKKMTISCAESCTGGLLSSNITSVKGSSKIFSMGLITYSNKAKNTILKVPKHIISKHGAVSSQCCLSMVNNLSKISKCKLCISITGIAGPNGGTKHKPVGLVYIGIIKAKKIMINKYQFKNKGRTYIQKMAVKKVSELIQKLIL